MTMEGVQRWMTRGGAGMTNGVRRFFDPQTGEGGEPCGGAFRPDPSQRGDVRRSGASVFLGVRAAASGR